jgi:hypothetical protein
VSSVSVFVSWLGRECAVHHRAAASQLLMSASAASVQHPNISVGTSGAWGKSPSGGESGCVLI